MFALGCLYPNITKKKKKNYKNPNGGSWVDEFNKWLSLDNLTRKIVWRLINKLLGNDVRICNDI